MDNTQVTNQQQNPSQENESAISLRDIVFIVLNNWYWFVISVILALVVTAFVYKSKPKAFTDNATILLRDDNNGKVGNRQNMDAIFANMGFDNSSLSLENEIYIIKSTPLLMKTAGRLGMDSWCSRNSPFRKISYYKDRPMSLKMFNMQVDSVQLALSLEVTPRDKDNYEYRIISFNGNKVRGDKNTASFNQIVKVNEYCSFAIEKTENFGGRDIDVTFDMGYSPLYNVAKSMQHRLNVSRVDKIASIISISFTDANANRTREVVDTLIAVYNEDVINDKNMVAQKTEQFIDDRIALIYNELSAVDARVESLQKSSNVPDVASASGTILQTGMRYNDEVVSLEAEKNMIIYIKDYVEDHSHDTELIPSLIISDAGVQNLINVYNQQLLSYQKLIQGAGANNPIAKNTLQELTSTREAIHSSVLNLLNSVNMKLQKARQQEQRSQRQISNLPTQNKAVNEVTREQKIKEELYLYLLSKREENAMNLAVTVANAKVVESAAQVKVGPSLMMFALVGLVLGLAIPALVMFCISFFNTKLRGKPDVEKALSIPVLGEIPSKPESRVKDEVIVTATGTDTITEAFRILHSNIPFFLNDADKKVLQTVSTMPGEGKSFVSINLALSLAYTGKKTILVDLDLRKRSTSKTIDRHNRMGVIHYLLGKEESVENVITHSESSENLDYIVCEKTPPNATQLLMNGRFENLVKYLRENYDYVILDTTPAQIVADAAIVNRYADLTMYIMRVGKVSKAAFPFIQELNDKQKFKNMAIVLTDMPLIKKRYGGYGYGYGYGYGDDGENEKENKEK